MKISEMEKEAPFLLVPMHIEAMVCGKEDHNDYSDIRFRYDHLAKEPSGKTLETEPFAGTDSYAPGIYLHWILPEGLTHGIQQQEGEAPVYPAVPNRYMVTRLALQEKEGGQTLQRKEWVIESDRIQPPPARTMEALRLARTCSSVADSSDPKKPYLYIGMKHEYEEYEKVTVPDARVWSPLTAVTSGNPCFTAYYPMCRNVFAFWDDLAELGNVPAKLTYVVSGWYEESEDPLFDKGYDTDEIRQILLLEWEGMENDVRRHMICHGMVSRIEWKGEDVLYPSGRTDSWKVPSIAAGYSSAETLAAFIGSRGKSPGQERITEALLEGVLEQWEEADGFLEAERCLFQRLFRSESVSDEQLLESKRGVIYAKGQELAVKINALREEMEREDEDLREIRQEAYQLWCRAADGKESASLAESLLEESKKNILEKLIRKSGLKEEETKQKEALSRYLKTCPKEEEWSSRDIPGQNYWLANDIAVLLEGESQSSIYRKLEKYKQEGRIPCRKEKELVCQILFDISAAGGKEKQTLVVHAAELLPASKVPLPSILEQIVQEAFLYAESCRSFFLPLLAKQYQVAGEEEQSRNNYIEYMEQEYDRQMRLEAHVQGKVPNMTAVHQWSPSWNPLFLEWEIEFFPDAALYGAGVNSECYSGRTILSHHALLNMEEQLKNYMGTSCQPLLERLGSAKILSQCLSGLNEQMLGRKRDAVTMIWERFPGDPLAKKARDIVGEESVWQETKRQYYPIRAGSLLIRRLRVVDSFGRAREYDPNHVIYSERGREGEEKNDTGRMKLVPQILTPARIWARWLQYPLDGNSMAEELAPVYGFIWANRFDSCLHIYTPDGKMAGSLQLVYDLENKNRYKVMLRNPPGEVWKEGELLEHLPEELKNFVEALYENVQKNPQILYELICAVDNRIWNVLPTDLKKAETIRAGLGSPAVLAGIKLRVETKEKPAGILKNLRFPVYVGDRGRKGDGVIGFFEIEGDSRKESYHVLNLVGEDESETKKGYLRNRSMIETGFLQEKELTLLFLPESKIHLSVEFLPQKEMRLPPDLVEEAISRIYMVLFYGPFLTEKGNVELMKPKAMEKEWKFISFRKPEALEEEKIPSAPQMEADFTRRGMEVTEGWLKLQSENGRNK